TTLTTYTQYVTDAAGCSDSATVTIDVLPLPVVNAGNDQTVCPGNQVTLSGSGANTYTWSGGITDGVPFTPATTANYTVTGTAANGCQNTDMVTVTLIDCSGLQEEAAWNFSLYPNPAADLLNLEADWNGTVEIRITDVNGKTLQMNKVPASGIITLDVSALPAGVYQLSCMYNNHMITRSFVRTAK
ncbi:MAG: T9SS type A sorting domain-containing protein, partial [Bacteroidia bacterium]|nr:T9SS type A sorting domain-containing protein [Bacteroidia bacterium]